MVVILEFFSKYNNIKIYNHFLEIFLQTACIELLCIVLFPYGYIGAAAAKPKNHISNTKMDTTEKTVLYLSINCK